MLECALVRVPVIFFLFPGFLLTLAVVCAPAEVIHLKNGSAIWADHVRENGAHIEYDIGDNSYAIPKSVVERVEAGGIPPEYTSSGARSKDSDDVPVFAPTDNLKNEPGLLDKGCAGCPGAGRQCRHHRRRLFHCG